MRNWRAKFLLVLVGLSSLSAFSVGTDFTARQSENSAEPTASKCDQNVPIVYLTINPALVTKGLFSRGSRQLQMNWSLCGHLTNSADSIRLYNTNPAKMRPIELDSQALEKVFPNIVGRHATKVQVPEFEFGDRDLTSNASDPKTQRMHLKLPLQDSVLTERAFGATYLRESLSSLMLSEVALPGTHNSGAYSQYTDFLSQVVRKKFLIAQEESIFNQLVLGIRYLDLRVGYYPESPEKFFLNHDKIRIMPLKTIFDQVTRFMAATNEILVLDFHRFPVGFNAEAHQQLVEMIKAQPSWSTLALPESTLGTNITLGEMWAGGHRLFIAYEDEVVENGQHLLWENVIHLWANTAHIFQLKDYLSKRFALDVSFLQGRVLFTANAFLTPQVNDLVSGLQSPGLRDLAEKVSNAGLDKWFSTIWRSAFTIVSTDFFMGNRMIKLCTEVNLERAAAARRSSLVRRQTSSIEQEARYNDYVVKSSLFKSVPDWIVVRYVKTPSGLTPQRVRIVSQVEPN
ncbi:unnamed protein product [Notodromas monacha]|uniref:PI-PLC X domain-containing protein 1 n=1 Tax=Notodromas monacha TaxID=399045 RepID=A0A7R9BXG7_9CRUS|nr:unnamed protein product [Notodromas monacha]CAG0922200.1 unnamed protein product [Notodromas monacha]